jgi:hypothetical protein
MSLTVPSRPYRPARQPSRAIAASQSNDAAHVGGAVVGSLLVGGGIWIVLAHLLKALL